MIGARIKSRRLALGLSQKKLAAQTGIAQQTIHSLESGRSHSTKALVKLAQVLQTTPEWLDSGINSATNTISTGSNIAETPAEYGDQLIHLPIVGNTVSGYDADWWQQGCPNSWGDSHLNAPSIDPTAHALRVTNDRYHPRLLVGEVISVSRQQPCVTGEDVVIILSSGECLVRQLVKQQKTEITVVTITTEMQREVILMPSIMHLLPITGIYPSSRILSAT